LAIMMVEACTIDAIREVERGIDKLGAVCAVPEMAERLADISQSFQKLKKLLTDLYALDKCDKLCTHEIKSCHCPRMARMPEQIKQRWDELTKDKSEEQ